VFSKASIPTPNLHLQVVGPRSRCQVSRSTTQAHELPATGSPPLPFAPLKPGSLDLLATWSLLFSLFLPLSHPASPVQRENQTRKPHILWCTNLSRPLVGVPSERLIFLRFPPFFCLAERKIGGTIDCEVGISGVQWSFRELLNRFHLKVYSGFPSPSAFPDAKPAEVSAWLTRKSLQRKADRGTAGARAAETKGT